VSSEAGLSRFIAAQLVWDRAFAEGLHAAAELAEDVGELAGPEDDQDDHEDEDQLRSADVEGHCSLPLRACARVL